MSDILNFINSPCVSRNEILSLLIDKTDQIIFILSVNPGNHYTYQYLNRAYEKLLNIERDKLIGQEFRKYLPKDICADIIALFNKAVAEKQIQANNIQLNISEKKIHLLASIHPIKNITGEVNSLLIAASDISDKVELDEQLRKAEDRARESDRYTSSLLSNMSHEVRTPLNGIIGFSEILYQELQDEEHKDMLDSILESAKRLLSSLNSILELSRLESLQNPVYKSKLSICELLDKITIKYEQAAMKKKLFFKKEYLTYSIYSHIDEYFFTHIINSILENAIKFTKQGGVTVKLYPEFIDGNYFSCIAISDTGIGIPEKDRKLIFDKFKQVSQGLSRSHEGMGLGLTLAKLMIEMLNGTIFLESVENEGTTVFIRLPAINEEVKKHKTEFQDISVKINNGLPIILIVEDSLYNQKLLSLYLKSKYEIRFAQSGEKAIELINYNYFDGILMDIDLGAGMNGVDVLRHIRTLERYKEVPVIALTGHALPQDENNILSIGFDSYLSKPIEKNKIVQMLECLIAGETYAV